MTTSIEAPGTLQGTTSRLTRRRRVIGRRLRQSVTTKPPVTLHAAAPAAQMLEFISGASPRVTVNGCVAHAVAVTLARHTGMNAHVTEDEVTTFATVNIGIAVDAPAGLIVPVIRDAQHLNAAELTDAIAKIAASARAGDCTPEQLADATFTISSLGSLGVEYFTPVIDPPQVAVLGVGATRSGIDTSGAVVPELCLSLSFDHAAIDGAPAARFLADLIQELQQPSATVAPSSGALPMETPA